MKGLHQEYNTERYVSVFNSHLNHEIFTFTREHLATLYIVHDE